tara:strand:- start:4209 stop:4526 length:318 start_codon:yes stop_codon:yes gene_type:complete
MSGNYYHTMTDDCDVTSKATSLVREYYDVAKLAYGDRLFNDIRCLSWLQLDENGDFVDIVLTFADGQEKAVSLRNQQMFSLTISECILWDAFTSSVNCRVNLPIS